MKRRLRPAIIPSLIATFAAGLACMSGVYFDHRDTTLLCFVRDKAIELAKTPTMQAALLRSVALTRAAHTN